MENLEEFVNDEQLLDFALSVLIRDDDNDTAQGILLCYGINSFLREGIEPEPEQVEEKLQNLFVEYVKRFMVEEEMGEVVFDETGKPDYSFTDEGKAVMNAILQARYG